MIEPITKYIVKCDRCGRVMGTMGQKEFYNYEAAMFEAQVMWNVSDSKNKITCRMCDADDTEVEQT